MIAEPEDATPVGPSIPPASASPQGGRPRPRTMLIAALVVIGGLGGGALGAEAVISRLPATLNTSAISSQTTSSASNAAAAQPVSAAALYKQAAPGIVTITTEVARRGRTGEGTGSGIVLDTSGNILTNAHVITGASQIQVTFSDGKTASASVAGSNTAADLAVVHVSVAAATLHPIPLCRSNTLRACHADYPIGSPLRLAQTMTAGLVARLNRATPGTGLSGLIQTDAP